MGGVAGHETTGPALPAVVKVLMFSGSIAVFVLNTIKHGIKQYGHREVTHDLIKIYTALRIIVVKVIIMLLISFPL